MPFGLMAYQFFLEFETVAGGGPPWGNGILVNFRKKLKCELYCKEGKSKHILLGNLSMAATASRVTVFVKPLFGDTLSLKVDPKKGLEGVADKLSRSDPAAFPVGLTVVSFIDEEQKEITDETMLAVLVKEPLESIVRVDTFDWDGNTSYRLRIKADRTKSMRWMLDSLIGIDEDDGSLDLRRQYPQLFDIAYFLEDRAFVIPFGGAPLDSYTMRSGKSAKRPATVLFQPIVYRRDNVGLHEFDDDISRLPTEAEQIDWSGFQLYDDAIKRISALIKNWMSEKGF